MIYAKLPFGKTSNIEKDLGLYATKINVLIGTILEKQTSHDGGAASKDTICLVFLS